MTMESAAGGVGVSRATEAERATTVFERSAEHKPCPFMAVICECFPVRGAEPRP